MSHVFYKFSSSKTESRVTFDGTHISLFDLKKEIIIANKMGAGGAGGRDFDLGVYDNVTNEEIKDDNHQIPRSTSVLVRRLPPAKGPMKGTAARYLAGTLTSVSGVGDGVDRRVEAGSRAEVAAKTAARFGMGIGVGMGAPGRGHMTKRFDGKDEKASTPEAPSAPAASSGSAEEDARMLAIMQEQAHQWDLAQEDLSTQTRVQYGDRGRGRGRGGAHHGGPSHHIIEHSGPPPQGYICYRCGQKGHWIQECPTNEDPDWENKPRFKRTTGIPKSFLKVVEQPAGSEGSSAGVMVTADGSFVMAQPDTQTWKKHTKTRALTEADIRESAPVDAALSCPIDNKLMREAVKTPCCGTTYCEDCIHTALLDHEFVCPNCESKIGSLDKLKPNDDVRAKVEEYVKGQVEKNKAAGVHEEKPVDVKKEEARAGSKSPAAKSAASAEAGEVAPTEELPQPDAANMQMMQEFAANFAMNPMMQMQAMQMQMAQIMMTLNNPQLAPQMRMQLTMQAQMLGASLQQMQMMATSTMGMGDMYNMQGMSNGMQGMNGMGMQQSANSGGMQSKGQTPGYRNGIPTGPAAGRRGGGPAAQHQQQRQNRPGPYDRNAAPAAAAKSGRGVPTTPANRNARY